MDPSFKKGETIQEDDRLFQLGFYSSTRASSPFVVTAADQEMEEQKFSSLFSRMFSTSHNESERLSTTCEWEMGFSVGKGQREMK